MPLRDDLLLPIPGENPSGANLRYDPVTDKIKEARREDLDVPQGEWKTALKTADHNLVIKLGSDAIAKKGKDLQIAVWLVEAHVKKEGFPVLSSCFEFLREFLEMFWDTLYPEVDEDGDMEVRAAPLVWLGSKLGEPLGFLPIVARKLSWLKYQESRTVGYEGDADNNDKQDTRQARISEGKITAEEFDEAADETSVQALRVTYEQLNESLRTLEALSEFCDQQFGDFTPSFIKTREALDEIAQTVRIILSRKPGGLEEETTEEAPIDDFAMSFDTESTSSDSDSDQSSSSREVETRTPAFSGDRGGIARQLAGLCKALRQLDAEDPSPYLLLRTFAWSAMMLNAPLINQSEIEPPPSDLRVRLKKLTNEGEWDQIIEITEAAMLQPFGRTWLDLQRYAVNALEQKGSGSAARVVNNHFRVYLEILPDVLDLTLPDDTPAANSDTKNWIENFVTIQKVPLKAPDSDSSSSDDSSSDSFSSDFSSDSFSFDTPSEDTPTEDTPSMDFSFDSSSDSSSESTPEPEPEPDPYTVEDSPPILESEEPPPSDTSDEFGQALQAVREGRTAEGLGIITALLATERSGRARFRRRTQLAHLLMAAGKGKVAQPLLDELYDEIEARRLEEWEPHEAVAYPLELLWHCLTSADDERRAQLYTRICRLDPVRAVNSSF